MGAAIHDGAGIYLLPAPTRVHAPSYFPRSGTDPKKPRTYCNRIVTTGLPPCGEQDKGLLYNMTTNEKTMMIGYQTLDEYHALMMEAQIEMYLWDEEKRRTRKSDKAKFKAIRLAKLEARKVFK